MNILMTGGTGFIGTALCKDLFSKGHQITIKTRRLDAVDSRYKAITSFDQLPENEEFDVVVNLAGEPIADKRWSQSQKDKIITSRVNTTNELLDYLKLVAQKPKVFISGSAIGYYGIQPPLLGIDETAQADDSFASHICTSWESMALEAELLGIRTCLLRVGIVLGPDGGALKKMLLPFKLGLGGKMGSGQQWMSWIHLHDLIGIVNLCITDKNLTGPINGTAPHPVTNEQFTKALGSALKRPTVFTVPKFILKFVLGQMANELLIEGKQILPSKAIASGYSFEYSDINAALKNIL